MWLHAILFNIKAYFYGYYGFNYIYEGLSIFLLKYMKYSNTHSHHVCIDLFYKYMVEYD